MTIRYLSQRDRYGCEPIALCNALKFQGQKITYRDVADIKRRVNWRAGHGTDRADGDRLRRKLGFTRMYKTDATPGEHFARLNRWLFCGNGAIIDLMVPIRPIRKGNRRGFYFLGHPVFVPGIKVIEGEVLYYMTNFSRPSHHMWLSLEEIMTLPKNLPQGSHVMIDTIWKVPAKRAA